MRDRTRTQPAPEPICANPECGSAFPLKTPSQRFCSPACRAAYSRRRQLDGIPARLGAGPRRLKSGAWSITVHLDELPNAGPGAELRIKVIEP